MTAIKTVYVWERHAAVDLNRIREALVERETQNYVFLLYPNRASGKKTYRDHVILTDTLQEMIDYLRANRDRELANARARVATMEALKTIEMATLDRSVVLVTLDPPDARGNSTPAAPAGSEAVGGGVTAGDLAGGQPGSGPGPAQLAAG